MHRTRPGPHAGWWLSWPSGPFAVTAQECSDKRTKQELLDLSSTPDGGWAERGRPRIRRLRPVFRRPLLRELRQQLLLAGHTLDREDIDRDRVEPREEVLGTAGIRLTVFLHQQFAEPLLDRAVVRDADPAEQDDASVSQAGVAFEATIIEDLVRLVELKTDPRLASDVRLQVPERAGAVQQDLIVRPDIQHR